MPKKEKEKIDPKIIAEFKLNGGTDKVRLSLLEFDNGSFVDIRKVTTTADGKDIIKKGISIRFEYWQVFMDSLNKISQDAIEQGVIDDTYFIDLGDTSTLEFAGLEK